MTQEAQTKLLHGELSYQINGLLFDVHNELGQFAKEKQYGDLLEKKLKENNIGYRRELVVGESGNICDFLVEGKVLLELKSKPFLLNSDYDQVKRYLHSCDLELGILVNFRSKYLKPKRVIRTKPNL